MSDQFQTWLDVEGNLYMQGGTLIAIPNHATDPTEVYTLSEVGALNIADTPAPFRIVPQLGGQAFVGGSGRNVITAGTVSGTNAPVGYFRQLSELEWADQYGSVITFDPSDGSAVMEDSTDTIATMPAGAATTAPYGTFTATTYGEDTYNGGSGFTLASSYEGRTEWPSLTIEVDGGTAQTGVYSSTGWGAWWSDDDNDWTVTVATDGSAEISDNTDVVATRATGADGIGDGVYISTAYGETTYNSGDPFAMIATFVSVSAPIAGFLYVTVNLTTGNPSSLSGPSFASAMPANSGTAKHVPVAYSDGSTVYQIQRGPIFWK
ncbi:hypothetical protein K0U83_02610 [bacterium]|nr:hypothetical protein [bacterium]